MDKCQYRIIAQRQMIDPCGETPAVFHKGRFWCRYHLQEKLVGLDKWLEGIGENVKNTLIEVEEITCLLQSLEEDASQESLSQDEEVSEECPEASGS